MSKTYPDTPDGRYFVVKGRLWRRSNAAIDELTRAALVKGFDGCAPGSLRLIGRLASYGRTSHRFCASLPIPPYQDNPSRSPTSSSIVFSSILF